MDYKADCGNKSSTSCSKYVREVNTSQDTRQQQPTRKEVNSEDNNVILLPEKAAIHGTTIYSALVDDRRKRIMPQEELILTPEMFLALPTNAPLRIYEDHLAALCFLFWRFFLVSFEKEA
ncbi:hypothetical protein K7X08_028606 [Anisodus acutangulus]|uniref:Uncharacterized protein n=1 Tax=Anisodus acutangulus TaxID=402998 RepID=A0A9Q1LVF2_9SOLA|nr:hypothetical protein K7X08_028606 [Anisodus acutangulus]